MSPHRKADARADREKRRFADRLEGCDTVGDKIRVLRVHRGLTQETLAMKLGVQAKDVSEIELGKRRISRSERKVLGRVLDVPVEQLL